MLVIPEDVNQLKEDSLLFKIEIDKLKMDVHELNGHKYEIKTQFYFLSKKHKIITKIVSVFIFFQLFLLIISYILLIT